MCARKNLNFPSETQLTHTRTHAQAQREKYTRARTGVFRKYTFLFSTRLIFDRPDFHEKLAHTFSLIEMTTKTKNNFPNKKIYQFQPTVTQFSRNVEHERKKTRFGENRLYTQISCCFFFLIWLCCVFETYNY